MTNRHASCGPFPATNESVLVQPAIAKAARLAARFSCTESPHAGSESASCFGAPQQID